MPEYGALRLINAIVIGYMVGTREVRGRGYGFHAADTFLKSTLPILLNKNIYLCSALFIHQ